ncbi:HAD family phosphatase [Ideonella sp. A 288]|uniref:HAD family hydrolase n=1 Tax=Ideonella sp. A 288 TaxID=1962181 RepID=UPI000B4AF2BE|nr:HAD family phosphatase [Ideonella sp. A 288]
MLRLTLFDLDHTLLDGDSDVLWCEFLMAQGVLDRATFSARNDAMAHGYQAGSVTVAEFCTFYVSTLAGRPRVAWEPLRRRFLDEVIAPRLADDAHALVRRHLDAGELVVMSTATNRFITELTAAHLGIPHLIATECERVGQGDGEHFTGRTLGTPNMRDGKVARLHDWLSQRRMALDDCVSTFYSDSMNDLPLLEAVRHPVAVCPDERLAAIAAERGWQVLALQRRGD